MEQLSIKELIRKYDIIIPEIQREYVWGINRGDILRNFLKDLKGEYSNSKELSEIKKAEHDKKSLELIQKYGYSDAGPYLTQLGVEYEQNKPIMDIGFLYSYGKQNNRTQFLIDGQQRFTTLFLGWFYLAIDIDKKDEFTKEFNFGTGTQEAFSYQVRDLTQRFFQDLISKINTTQDFITLIEKTWFLKDYKNDVTINAVTAAYKIINEELKDFDEKNEIFKYITEQVKFWYFNTASTSQGEELYITMNSRGKPISNNENVRAKLFENVKREDVIIWGAKWEEWQDLFWKNRKTNTNADKGFDSFLACIGGLTNHLKGDISKNLKQAEFENYRTPVNSIVESIDLETIKRYYDAFKFLNNKDNIKKFKGSYNNVQWLDDALNLIWDIFTESNKTNKTNWFANTKDTGRSVELRRMVFIWSVLHYVTDINSDISKVKDMYRVLRIFYMRYNNSLRGVAQIKDNINQMLKKGVWKYETEIGDEGRKHKALLLVNDDSVEEYEELIWEIENLKHNANGEDVGAINSGHIIDYDKLLNLDDLKLVHVKYKEIFNSNHKDLQTILLFYGIYWDKEGPSYYNNLRFNNWKRIIRGRSNRNSNNNIFKLFCDEFKAFDGNLNDFLSEKLKLHEVDNTTTDLREQIIWYAKKLGDKMWSNGDSIAISDDNHCALHNHGGKELDKVFPNRKVIFNTSGSLRHKFQHSLFSMLEDDIKEPYLINKTVDITT
jgi:hypothetical protein